MPSSSAAMVSRIVSWPVFLSTIFCFNRDRRDLVLDLPSARAFAPLLALHAEAVLVPRA